MSRSPLPLVHDARRLCAAFRAGNRFVGARELLALRSRLESAYLRPCSARVARALHVAADQIDLALAAGPGPSAPAAA